MSAVLTQNSQILTVLCTQGGVAIAGILGALQAAYPTTGWTLELLQTRLTNGIKQGLFIAVGGNPAGPVEGYAINKYALNINNPLNKVYGCFCSQIIPVQVPAE